MEIGVKPTLISIVKSLYDNKIFLASLNPQGNDWQQLLSSLRKLYLQGIAINWSAVTQNYQGQKVSLPTYPFQRQRYWFELPQEKSVTDIGNIIIQSDHLKITSRVPKQKLANSFNNLSSQNLIHPLLGKLLASPLKQTIFQSDFQPDTFKWLQEHCLA